MTHLEFCKAYLLRQATRKHHMLLFEKTFLGEDRRKQLSDPQPIAANDDSAIRRMK
jgi:hypothetical protein